MLTKYPISQSLSKLMESYEFSRIEFVQALGYRNIERGLRRLEPWLENGEGYDLILKQIVKTYPSVAAELELATVATTALKTAEAEAAFLERCKTEAETFVPFIHADGETTVPKGICIFGMTGGHRRWTTIEIPKAIGNLPLEKQLAAVPELMRGYKRLYNGACPFFGKLTGFKLVGLLDYSQFDQDGNFIEHVEKPFRRGSCSVQF
jgi:hypothetical protein